MTGSKNKSNAIKTKNSCRNVIVRILLKSDDQMGFVYLKNSRSICS